MNDLEIAYRAFIDCLNQRRWEDLGAFLPSEFTKNDQKLTLQTYAANIQAAGNLEFEIIVMTVDEKSKTLASTTFVRWKPLERVLGIEPSGKTLTFIGKYLNWFSRGKLSRMVDVIDREAIYRQLSNLEAIYTPDFDIAAWSKPEATGSSLSRHDLESFYRAYVRCLNEGTTQADLEAFFHPQLIHNGASKTVDALGNGLRDIASAIPDLVIKMTTIVIDEKAQRVAVRLEFTGTPIKSLPGIEATGVKGQWVEHATYQFRDGKTTLAWAIGNWGSYLQAVPESVRDVNLW
ncbi:hypothetical protein EV356DRAFT_506739 [Viridothelium virens]|uniref:SnoaL-like polyketide cyclase n=1 Tax=Viridothelium virens TaxID=1048519 RepID=A0A6A6H1E8_VIRVR|nr:hypothetical protein EV356DRAFT_506739 [Viridothelium virens]